MPNKLPFLTLFCLISFASVNAVMFTPALPSIGRYFLLSAANVQVTVFIFLLAYTLGQLIYGPLSNRFGRKPILYAGIGLQILASILAIYAAKSHIFLILVVARWLLGLGSGVGLKMTFTLVNEHYPPAVARQKISLLMLAFAITPGLSVGIGAWLTTHWGFVACFYASALYGMMLFLMTMHMTIPYIAPQLDALNFRRLLKGYGAQFSNPNLLTGALIMGATTSMVYIFAALAPFVVISLYQLPAEFYGLANLLPPLGLIGGSLCSAWLSPKITIKRLVHYGIGFALFGSVYLLLALGLIWPPLYSIFFPAIVINFGLSLILGNASAFALADAQDKAYGSAVMSFVNMGLATLMVFTLHFVKVDFSLLGKYYLGLVFLMWGLSLRL